jgi:hypothetical protein
MGPRPPTVEVVQGDWMRWATASAMRRRPGIGPNTARRNGVNNKENPPRRICAKIPTGYLTEHHRGLESSVRPPAAPGGVLFFDNSVLGRNS